MRTKSFFYSDRQNKLIEKAALSKSPSKRAKVLAKQFNRPYLSIVAKMTKIRKEHNVSDKTNSTVATRKEKFVNIAQGTTLNFPNVKRAEMHNDHVRIYF